MRTAWTSLFLFATAAAARAGDGFETYRELAVPSLLGYGRSVSGDLTGDGRADVAVVVDGRPVLLVGPDVYHGPSGGPLAVPIEVGGAEPVWDVALFEDVGPDRVDWLFTSGANGIVSWHLVDGVWTRDWIVGGAEPESTDPTTFDAISTYRYPGSGFTWLCALEDDGVTVRTLLFNASNGSFFSQLPARTLATAPITSFAAHNLDTDTYPELVTVSATGIGVWEPESGAHTVSILTTATAFATALDEPGPVDRLAYVIEYEGDAYLYAQNGIPETPLQFGTPGAVTAHGLAAGDVDGDGWDDVLVSSSETGARFLAFRNQRADTPSGPTFSASDTLTPLSPVEAASLVPGAVTELLVADLEDDGDDDVLLWDDAGVRGIQVRADEVDASALFPTVTQVNVPTDPPGEQFPFTVTVDGEAATIPPEATHVELIAWILDAGGTLQLVSEDAAVHALDEPAPALVLDLTVPPLGESLEWSLELRFVEETAGAPRRAWPSRTATLTVNYGSQSAPLGGGSGSGSNPPELRGEYTDITDLPPFPEDEVPLAMQTDPPQGR